MCKQECYLNLGTLQKYTIFFEVKQLYNNRDILVHFIA